MAISAESRLPAAKANAPDCVKAALRSAASEPPAMGVPQLSLLATTIPDESTTDIVGSAKVPGTFRAASAGPAARMRSVRSPVPAPIVMPGIMMSPLVPTSPRVERLISRAVAVEAPTS